MDDDETIFIDIQLTGFQINLEKLRRLAKRSLDLLGLTGFDLSLLLTDSERIRLLNKQYRDKDDSTDVLSFPQHQWQIPLDTQDNVKNYQMIAAIPDFQRSLGDIVISLPDAAENAVKIGQGLDRECCFLLVHGILHLCGHDHLESHDEVLMLRNQQEIMNILQPPQEPNWIACVAAGESTI